MTYSIKAIDCVVNPITPQIMKLRPAWSNSFWTQKIGRKPDLVAGVTHQQMLAALDAAGIERAFLMATKVGRLGLPGSWHLPYKLVADAVQKYPHRFYGLAGIDPTEGMRGVREFERSVREYGFIGAHAYPHWFGLAPDHARWYPLSLFHAMNAVALKVLLTIRKDGTKQGMIDAMQTRAEPYDYLDYHAYEARLDQLLAKDRRDCGRRTMPAWNHAAAFFAGRHATRIGNA